MAKLPRDLHGQCLPLVLKETYPDIYARGLIYLDIWPISPPMLAVFHPEIMNQFTVAKSPPKHEHLHHEFQDYTQCLDLVTSEGQHWKTWRSYLNPGFSAKNLTRLVPEMVEEIEVFRDWLRTTAMSGQVVSLAQNAEKLTVDIIGRLALWVCSTQFDSN
jgi:cytochrome P450